VITVLRWVDRAQRQLPRSRSNPLRRPEVIYVTCTVVSSTGEACPRRHYARGWCKMHYARWWTYGDVVPDRPIQEQAPDGEPAQFFEEHVMEPSSICRIWPYAINSEGYGHFKVGGADVGVHRLACERWNGPCPPRHQAAHSCNNRACWAGEHLRWATPAENLADRNGAGTAPRGSRNVNAKLSEADVRSIRAAHARGDRTQDLSTRYGVHRQTIYRIVTYKGWAHL
jgi:hypothetical protein